jgi:hypothetical protein
VTVSMIPFLGTEKVIIKIIFFTWELSHHWKTFLCSFLLFLFFLTSFFYCYFSLSLSPFISIYVFFLSLFLPIYFFFLLITNYYFFYCWILKHCCDQSVVQ